MNYLTNYSRDYATNTDAEKNDQPSMTVPDQTISLSELLERFTKGETVPTFPGQYQDDDDENVYDDLNTLDLSELEELAERVSSRRSELEESLSREQRAQAQEPAEGGKPQTSDGKEPDESLE